MPVSFRLLPTLTFLLLLPGVPVWALTASDTTRPAQAQDPLPDMGIAPQVDDDARHFAEVAKKFGEASMSDNGLTAGEQAQLFAISKIGNEVSHQLESWLSPWGNANVDLLVNKEGKFTGSKGSWFVPLQDNDRYLTWNQYSVTRREHDLVGNIGLGQRWRVNGTTNYILSRMDAEGADYADVLADAQAKGYAEADPSADVDGFDAASKTAILASIGFGTRVTTDDVYQEGIRTIGAEDIAQARELGYTIKLLGIARNTDAGVDVRVHPTLIPADHMLAKVNGAMNAVYVVGDAVGETMFYGAGAGSFPTASAVVGDILSLSEQISRGVAPLPEIEPYGHNLAFKPMDELQTKYYVRLKVADRVGALSETVDIFAKHNISISLINQVEDGKSGVSDACSVIFLTHRALEKDVQAAAAELASVDCVAEVANVLRIEDVGAWTEGVMAN